MSETKLTITEISIKKREFDEFCENAECSECYCRGGENGQCFINYLRKPEKDIEKIFNDWCINQNCEDCIYEPINSNDECLREFKKAYKIHEYIKGVEHNGRNE